MNEVAIQHATLAPLTESPQSRSADPSAVAEFEHLMQGPVDQYSQPQESPLEVMSSKLMKIGTEASASLNDQMRSFDAKLQSIDMTSPDALASVSQLQMQAFGALYQVQLATAIAGQANRGFQTLLHVQ